MRFPFAEYGSKELSFFGMFLFVMIVLSLFFYPLASIPFFVYSYFLFYISSEILTETFLMEKTV